MSYQEKSADRLSVDEIGGLYDNQGIPQVMRGTDGDQHDMYRMGKKPELRVCAAHDLDCAVTRIYIECC
jgi:hypothetical protein